MKDMQRIQIMITLTYKVDEVMRELFEPILSRYQTGLEEFMKGRDFVFEYFNVYIANVMK